MEKIRREKAVIGARLREAREMAGLSRQDAAEAADVQLSAIEAWERGTSLPTLVQFRDLLSCYGTMGYRVLFGSNPMEISQEEAVELRHAAGGFSPRLRRRLDLVLSVFGSACPTDG